MTLNFSNYRLECWKLYPILTSMEFMQGNGARSLLKPSYCVLTRQPLDNVQVTS